jgi:hypothetical protein
MQKERPQQTTRARRRRHRHRRRRAPRRTLGIRASKMQRQKSTRTPHSEGTRRTLCNSLLLTASNPVSRLVVHVEAKTLSLYAVWSSHLDVLLHFIIRLNNPNFGWFAKA